MPNNYWSKCTITTSTTIAVLTIISAIFLQTLAVTGQIANNSITIFQITMKQDDEKIDFKVFSTLETELTIKSNSDNSTIKKLRGKMFPNSLNHIISRLLQAGINELNSDKGNTNVYINYDNLVVNVTYDSFESTVQEVHQIVEGTLDRYSGEAFNSPMSWPLDISVIVLESYPEQYDLQAIIQRNDDPLTVVLKVNVSLDVMLTSNMSKRIYHDEITIEIASGGRSSVVKFLTFSLGESYRPEDVSFTISANSDVFLIYNLQEGSLEAFTSSDKSQNESSTKPVSLEAMPSFFLVMTAMALILRQKRK